MAEASINNLLLGNPEFESKEKFCRVVQRLYEDGYLTKTKVENDDGKKCACLMITKKGVSVLKETLGEKFELDCLMDRKINNRINTKMKRKKYKMTEAELFFKAGTKNTKDIKYFSKDYLLNLVVLANKEEMVKEYYAARVDGFVFAREKFIPVYNVDKTNIRILTRTETNFLDVMSELFRTEQTLNEKRILFTNSFDFLDDDFLGKVFLDSRKCNNQIGESRGVKTETIFPKEDARFRQQTHLLYNWEDQLKLIPFLVYNEKELNEILRPYILNMVKGKELLPDKDYAQAIYETNEEIGIQIVSQDLYKMYKLKKIIDYEIRKGEEKRTFVFYGDETNLMIYLKFYSEFYNTLFRELNLNEIKRRKKNE